MDGARSRARGWRGVRPATVIFAVVELAALVLILAAGRHEWFSLDEWDFLAARKAGDFGDLFRPHNEHWVTLPVLAYRFLYWSFGLRSYFPYRLLIAVVHLAAAALLLAVIRRAGVRPSIATAAASLLVLFGAGYQNIERPFQICFTGALAFGLVQLLLADHDGPFDRRDRLGLAAGLAALMCSGVGVSMVVIVGIAVLLRRGWRAAVFHTAPLAACYLVWLVAIGHKGYLGSRWSIHGVVEFVVVGGRTAFQNMGHVPLVGALLAIVLVVGLAFVGYDERHAKRRYHMEAPIALLAGSVVFLAITATGRLILGTSSARESRYVYLVATMTLPALAVAADAVVTRRRFLLPVAVALFVVGIPGGITTLGRAERHVQIGDAVTRRIMLTVPRIPLARHVPRSVVPNPGSARQVTVGWLLDGVAQHRIPSPGPISAREVASDAFRISFDQRRGRSPTTSCITVGRPVLVQLRKGDVIGLSQNTMQVAPAHGPPLAGLPLQFLAIGKPIAIVNTLGTVRMSAAHPFFPARVCIERAP